MDNESIGIELHSYEELAVWYAPDIMDNLAKKEENRFAVSLMPMSRQEIQRIEEGNSKLTPGKKVNLTKSWNKSRDLILRKCIAEVRHFAWTPKGQERIQVTTGVQLLACGRPEIEGVLEELLKAIKDQSILAEGLLGKSDLQSDICT